MNTSSWDAALPSGQMGSSKHLGLDGAAATNPSDARTRRSAPRPVPAFVEQKYIYIYIYGERI